MHIRVFGIYFVFLLVTVTLNVSAGTRQESVTGGPRGISPYLFKQTSSKNLVETAKNHSWSIQFHKSTPETLHVIAFRIEFAKDTSVQTTGNGLFGIRNGGDKEEVAYYDNDTSYIYDALPHDSLYFDRQLTAVRNYYNKISRGMLTVDFSIYPSRGDQYGYAVEQIMPFYSPGGKRKKETWDEYYERKTRGLITFVRDAIRAADGSKDNSPFKGLEYRSSDKSIRDEKGRKTVFLIFHAGSSYLTDGGEQGSMGQDTPSDMIDAFITPDFWKYYRDSLKLDENGISVSGKNGKFLVDEIMMCSETSNQDGLNWGIQGIIVNQIARQLGIPDLFSTSSGISGIGAFCIMDFAGYSAGKGFIPPYPSAWVRAFMGWDAPVVVTPNLGKDIAVKALTSVLDRDTSNFSPAGSDTTILLVPINDHEYYLIENRQRNLAGNRQLFNYDTLDPDDSVVISSYPYVANLDKNVLALSGKDRSNVILRVKNNDIGLPASGVLVWHVDERIIRDRLNLNAVNADSLYRGVSLVEADGITDLGIMFRDLFYQAAFDYGGAEDVFPHSVTVQGKDTAININRFGPYSFPSTRANDGGHSYLEITINPSQDSPRIEKTALAKNDGYHYIRNISDSLFLISISQNYHAPSWPKRTVPGKVFDPLLVDLDLQNSTKELFVLDQAGRIYIWSDTKTYNTTPSAFDRINLHNDTLPKADTAWYYDSVSGAFTMPSAVGSDIFIPCRDNKIAVFGAISTSTPPRYSTIPLSIKPSSYLCNYADSSWALGGENGTVLFGQNRDTVRLIKLATDAPVCAIAALRERADAVAVLQLDGRLSVVGSSSPYSKDSSVVLPKNALPPFTIVTADLDKSSDNQSEIIITDSRMGMWVYHQNFTLAHGWVEDPSDDPSYYSDTARDRRKLPQNHSAPALADIDRDGFLDIIVGGTNGIYAFNHKRALKSNWPAFLDKTYWYQRGSITTSPVIVTGADKKPLVLFASATGDNPTFRFTKITRADKARKTVWFTKETGEADSIWDLTANEIDTILTFNDSLIAPYYIPGGLIDAVNSSAKRPSSLINNRLQSPWPLTTGSSLYTAPLIGFMDDDKTPDLFATANDGTIYRWELPSGTLPDTLFWPQTGYNAGRSFAYGGAALQKSTENNEPLTFFSFPNPVTKGIESAIFKYRFGDPATSVKLDIYSYTGHKVYSNSHMGSPPHQLSGDPHDWNVLYVSTRNFTPGVYRCRMEATISGKKHHNYWKLAVIK